MSTTKQIRVSLQLNNDLTERVDVEAKKLGVSRTAYINMALNSYLAQQETMRNLPEMLGEMSGIMDKMNELKKALPELEKRGRAERASLS